jgi:hypothetical protein
MSGIHYEYQHCVSLQQNVQNFKVLIEIWVNLSSVILNSCLLHTGFALGLVFHPEDRCVMFLQNVGLLSPEYTVL